MIFLNLLNHFKINYLKIKKKIKKAIKDNKIISGSGGSNNIIIDIDNYILKIIPYFLNPLLKINPNNDYLESNIYIKLTDEFILTNKTPHIIGIFKKYYIDDIKIIFPNKCLTIDDELLKNKENNNKKLCYLKDSYYQKLLDNKLSILVLEKCNDSISSIIYILLTSKISFKKKIIQFENILYRIIFQLIFTLTLITDKYPNFIHNDLFLRNILANYYYNYNNNDYIEYNLNNKKYYLPANGIYIKINDFGYTLNILNQNSTLENEIKYSINNSFEINNKYRDIYTFFFDLYDGPNIGSLSIKSLINKYVKKNQKDKYLICLQNVIGNFFDYITIDEIHKNKLGILDNIWSISKSKILMKTVKQPKEYFISNIFNFYTIKPYNINIINIYN
jgi:hypothetical protein